MIKGALQSKKTKIYNNTDNYNKNAIIIVNYNNSTKIK